MDGPSTEYRAHLPHAGDYPLDMAKTYYAKKRLRYLRRACGL